MSESGRKSIAARVVRRSVSVKDRRARFVFSTSDEDNHGDRIDQAGWQLESFKKNPVALWAHDATAPPIGRAEDVRVENGRLMGTIVFAKPSENPMGESALRMVKAGLLNAVSVGFDSLEMNEIYDEKTTPPRFRGFHHKKMVLREISLVPIPANENAIVVSKSVREAARPMLDDLRARLEKAEPGLDIFRAGKIYRALGGRGIVTSSGIIGDGARPIGVRGKALDPSEAEDFDEDADVSEDDQAITEQDIEEDAFLGAVQEDDMNEDDPANEVNAMTDDEDLEAEASEDMDEAKLGDLDDGEVDVDVEAMDEDEDEDEAAGVEMNEDAADEAKAGESAFDHPDGGGLGDGETEVPRLDPDNVARSQEAKWQKRARARFARSSHDAFPLAVAEDVRKNWPEIWEAERYPQIWGKLRRDSVAMRGRSKVLQKGSASAFRIREEVAARYGRAKGIKSLSIQVRNLICDERGWPAQREQLAKAKTIVEKHRASARKMRRGDDGSSREIKSLADLKGRRIKLRGGAEDLVASIVEQTIEATRREIARRQGRVQ